MRKVLIAVFILLLVCAVALAYPPTEAKYYTSGSGATTLVTGRMDWIEIYSPDADTRITLRDGAGDKRWPVGTVGDTFYTVFAGVPRRLPVGKQSNINIAYLNRQGATKLEITWGK